MTRIKTIDAFGLESIHDFSDWLAVNGDLDAQGIDGKALAEHLRAGRVVALGARPHQSARPTCETHKKAARYPAAGDAPLTRIVRADVTDLGDDNTVWL
jgi:hypothetical protein